MKWGRVGIFSYTGFEIGRGFSRSVDAGANAGRGTPLMVLVAIFALPYFFAGRGTVGVLFAGFAYLPLAFGERLGELVGMTNDWTDVVGAVVGWVALCAFAIVVGLMRGNREASHGAARS